MKCLNYYVDFNSDFEIFYTNLSNEQKMKFMYLFENAFGRRFICHKEIRLSIYKINVIKWVFECIHFYSINNKEISYKNLKSDSFMTFLNKIVQKHFEIMFGMKIPLTINIYEE